MSPRIRPAELRTCMVTQDLNPDHWEWTASEKAAFTPNADARKMTKAISKVFLARFQQAGCSFEGAYAIIHDKDENAIWDEYENTFTVRPASAHIHIVVKFAGGGKMLEEIAEIAGVGTNYIEKPRTGRYAYNNMLSYLTHIKYPKKYCYDPKDVVTLAGRDYTEIYSENHASWLRNRANRMVQDAKIDKNTLISLLLEDKIFPRDLVLSEQYTNAYIINKVAIDRVIKNRFEYIRMRILPSDRTGKIDVNAAIKVREMQNDYMEMQKSEWFTKYNGTVEDVLRSWGKSL